MGLWARAKWHSPCKDKRLPLASSSLQIAASASRPSFSPFHPTFIHVMHVLDVGLLASAACAPRKSIRSIVVLIRPIRSANKLMGLARRISFWRIQKGAMFIISHQRRYCSSQNGCWQRVYANEDAEAATQESESLVHKSSMGEIMEVYARR